MSAASKPAPRWHPVLGPFAAAAAVLVIAFSGVGLVAKSAHPGDRLWSLTKVLYTDYARSVEAAERVKAELVEADKAIRQGNTPQAKESLDRVEQELSEVNEDQNRTELAAQYQQLEEKLQRGDVDGEAPVTDPKPAPPSSLAAPVLPVPSESASATPSAPPTTESSVPPSSSEPPTPTSSVPNEPGPRSEEPIPSTSRMEPDCQVPELSESRSADGQKSRQYTVDEQRSCLRKGQLAYRVPSSMRQENWYRVVVRVSGLEYYLDPTVLPGEGLTATHKVEVGPDLVANLNGPDFSISRVPPDDGRRTLPIQDYAEWQWNVKPVTTGGREELALVLSVHLPNSDQPPIKVETVIVNVLIETNVPYVAARWAKDYGPATGLTIPAIVGGVWALLRLRQASRNSKPRGAQN